VFDRQGVLRNSAPPEVNSYVRRVVQMLSSQDGGLILRGQIGSDTPLENANAMLEAFVEYGTQYSEITQKSK